MASREDNYRGVFGGGLVFGRRPAVLSVDFQRGYTIPESPMYAPGVVEAVARAGTFYDEVRALSVPLLYTRVLFDEPTRESRVFTTKIPALNNLVSGNPAAEFDPAIAPRAGEPVLSKQGASSFSRTDLHSRLTAMGVDTLVVTGCTTSGCIRATVVDAMQLGYVPVVVSDLVGDRHPEPHDANMFDMTAKYAIAMPAAEALDHLRAAQRRLV